MIFEKYSSVIEIFVKIPNDVKIVTNPPKFGEVKITACFQ